MKDGKIEEVNPEELNKVTYDVTSIPKGLTLDEIFKAYKKTGVLLYDSNRGPRPQIIKLTKRRKLKIQDMDELVKEMNGNG